MATEQEHIEEELIYGARRREQLWQKLGIAGMAFGVIGCLSAAAVAVLDVDPEPVVVPFNPETGMALPNAQVQTQRITENQAIIESVAFRYVTDRETYNQLDNDVRVRSILERSDGAALASMRSLWDSANPNYPPELYGDNSRLEVEVLSINRIGVNRAQVRIRKRLTSNQGVQAGLFTATMLFEFRPEERRSIDDVWSNPFGFTVTEYSIRSDRLEN